MNEKEILSLLKNSISSIDDLSKKCGESLDNLKNLYKNKKIPIDQLKSNTTNIFEDLKKLIKSKEQEILSSLSNIEFLEDFLKKEMTEISKKMEELFTEQQLSPLKTIQDILNFFAKNENELNDFLAKNYKGISYLKYYMLRELEELFKNNNLISNITKEFMSKKKEIFKQSNSEKEFSEKLRSTYPNTKIAEFLIDEENKDLVFKSFLIKKETKANNVLAEIYEKIVKNEMNILDGINNKKELLFLFIAINNRTAHRSYYEEPFLSIFKFNEYSIKKYFGKNIEYQNILDKFSKMNEEQEKTEIENLIKIIENDINSKDKLFNIIASMHYILLYKFKDPKKYKSLCNSGNTYINQIYKNFVLFLDKKLKTKLNLNQNVFELVNELYSTDIKFSITQNLINAENKSYSYMEIGKTLKNLKSLSDLYNDLDKDFLLLDDPIAIIKKNIDKKVYNKVEIYDENIHLIPLNIKVNTNTVTIIIYGFADEVNKKDKEKTNIIHQNRISQWKDLTE